MINHLSSESLFHECHLLPFYIRRWIWLQTGSQSGLGLYCINDLYSFIYSFTILRGLVISFFFILLLAYVVLTWASPPSRSYFPYTLIPIPFSVTPISVFLHPIIFLLHSSSYTFPLFCFCPVSLPPFPSSIPISDSFFPFFLLSFSSFSYPSSLPYPFPSSSPLILYPFLLFLTHLSSPILPLSNSPYPISYPYPYPILFLFPLPLPSFPALTLHPLPPPPTALSLRRLIRKGRLSCQHSPDFGFLVGAFSSLFIFFL